MVMPPPDWLDATTVCPKRVQLEFHGLVCDIVMTDSLRAGSKVLAHASDELARARTSWTAGR